MNSPARILVVEDDTAMRELLQSYLKRQGYVVIEACDGNVALPILKSDERIDLLLTDVVMPGSHDGFALGRAARRIRPGLKVLHVTGFSDRLKSHPELVRRGNLLRKPVERGELLDRVGRLLGCWAVEQNDTLCRAYDYWLEKAAKETLPNRKDLDPAEITDLLPDLSILEAVGPGRRHRYRLVGTRVVEAMGFDPVNRFVDDIFAPEDGAFLERLFGEVHARRQPLYAASTFRSAEGGLSTERLLLPFSVSADIALQIVVVQTFDWALRTDTFHELARHQMLRTDTIEWPHR
jgi:DNA-binding response OmpR family regulator